MGIIALRGMIRQEDRESYVRTLKAKGIISSEKSDDNPGSFIPYPDGPVPFVSHALINKYVNKKVCKLIDNEYVKSDNNCVKRRYKCGKNGNNKAEAIKSNKSRTCSSRNSGDVSFSAVNVGKLKDRGFKHQYEYTSVEFRHRNIKSFLTIKGEKSFLNNKNPLSSGLESELFLWPSAYKKSKNILQHKIVKVSDGFSVCSKEWDPSRCEWGFWNGCIKFDNLKEAMRLICRRGDKVNCFYLPPLRQPKNVPNPNTISNQRGKFPTRNSTLRQPKKVNAQIVKPNISKQRPPFRH